jgi:hypothetical protein
MASLLEMPTGYEVEVHDRVGHERNDRIPCTLCDFNRVCRDLDRTGSPAEGLDNVLLASASSAARIALSSVSQPSLNYAFAVTSSQNISDVAARLAQALAETVEGTYFVAGWLASRLAAPHVAIASMWGTPTAEEPDQRQPARAIETVAGRLREISGLDARRLASLFGVSRATYHHWLAGSNPRGDRLDHVLEVVSLVEEALERFGNASQTSVWLRTPVRPGGPTPLDLLRTRSVDAFRGFLTRLPIEQRLLRRPLPPRARRRLSAEERADAAGLYNPRSWEGDSAPMSPGNSES